MGDLAAHITDTARVPHPNRAVPAELDSLFAVLGHTTSGMADRVGELITAPVQGGFAELDRTDQAGNALHTRILAQITRPRLDVRGADGVEPRAADPLLRTLRRPGRIGGPVAGVRRDRQPARRYLNHRTGRRCCTSSRLPAFGPRRTVSR